MVAKSTSLPLSEAVEEYLQWLELDRHASPGTVAGYRDELWRFQSFVDSPVEKLRLGDLQVAAIDRDLVRAYQRSVSRATTGPSDDPHPLAAATRKRRLIALRSFLRFAQRERWIVADLASTVDLPKLPERLPKPLENDDRERLVAGLTASTLKDHRDKAFILLLLSTGARISEILNLDRTDWGGDRLIVRGKGDRERPVIITERTRRAMDAYLAMRVDPSPALFVGLQRASTAKPPRLTPAGSRHICHQLAKRFGIPPFHPHQLRHTLGTLLQENIGDARLTAETLGHVGLASVAGYTKITEGRRRLARDTVEEAGL